MIARLNLWWAGLTDREKWLVGLAAALTMAVFVWALFWGPLGRAYAQVDADYRAAVARQSRVAAKIDLLKAPAGPARAAVALDALARDTAAEIGVTLDRNDARGADRTTIAVASIRSQALLPWLDGLERQGVIIDQLSVTPAPDRTLAVVVELRRAP